MFVFRAMFWLSIVTMLMPQEATSGHSEVSRFVGNSPAASELGAPLSLVAELQITLQRKLQNLKEQRLTLKTLEIDTLI
jgi:hypothetical protein